jgi:hypothetical protein
VNPATAIQDLAGMNEAQRYDHLRALAEQNGGRIDETPGQRNIISLRTETNTGANNGQGVYDDKTYVMWTDQNGQRHVREYDSNTEPSGRYQGRYGVDANGDGSRDLGRIPAGYYEYAVERGHSQFGNVLRPTQSINAERDTNHDGRFNDGHFGDSGRTMLFHAGGNNMTGSAGCQTMRPADYDRFWRDVTGGGNGARIGYTLINVN